MDALWLCSWFGGVVLVYTYTVREGMVVGLDQMEAVIVNM